MGKSLKEKLQDFADKNKFHQKGPLCVALVLTEKAQTEGLPLSKKKLFTKGKGQVQGLGKAAVQRILERNGIKRVLAEEGGRTSRGSIRNAEKYCDFLNDLFKNREIERSDLKLVESFWVDRVRGYFSRKPFVLKMDVAASIRSFIRDLLNQVKKRQKEYPGSTMLGTVLQHLVGAKLEMISRNNLEHYGASVADQSTERKGDFSIGDVVVHVTTAPTEALIWKCRENLEAGLRPWIVTIVEGVPAAQLFAENINLVDRIDVCDIEQFLTCNFMERGDFEHAGRKKIAQDIIEKYNKIIDETESDPGLKITLR